jgi:hypothetical protein
MAAHIETTSDPANRPQKRPIRHSAVQMGRDLLVLFAVMVTASACPKAPLGPPFDPAPFPPNHRARLYVYRVDDRSSLATVRITLDGQNIGRFRNREYETFELPAGSHNLRAGMRGFGLLAWGWNEQRIRMGPGETVYVKISVRLDAQTAPSSREIEIAGRESGSASENVFIIPRSAAEAISELYGTTRLAGSEAPAE